MKILIDCRLYGPKHAGIGRYVKNLVDNLYQKKEVELSLLVRREDAALIEKTYPLGRVILAEAEHYSFKEQIVLPRILNREKPDLVHFPHFNVPLFYFGKYVVTIHDLIKHSSRGAQTTTKQPLFYWLKYLFYRLVFLKAVKGASAVIVPSRSVKTELVGRYSLNEGKVFVTYEGVDEIYHRSAGNKEEGERVLKKYGVEKPFVIYTGSVYPHKNVETLIQAIKLLNENPDVDALGGDGCLRLVVVCARNVFWERLQKKIEEMGAEKWVILTGYIPDDELICLYRQAVAFVFPSLMEGFGLPGLEAMACGVPEVCSQIPVFKEIYGEAAVYFNPFDPRNMAEKIKEVGSLGQSDRDKIIKRGQSQAQKYSWGKMAAETIRVYRQVI